MIKKSFPFAPVAIIFSVCFVSIPNSAKAATNRISPQESASQVMANHNTLQTQFDKSQGSAAKVPVTLEPASQRRIVTPEEAMLERRRALKKERDELSMTRKLALQKERKSEDLQIVAPATAMAVSATGVFLGMYFHLYGLALASFFAFTAVPVALFFLFKYLARSTGREAADYSRRIGEISDKLWFE